MLPGAQAFTSIGGVILPALSLPCGDKRAARVVDLDSHDGSDSEGEEAKASAAVDAYFGPTEVVMLDGGVVVATGGDANAHLHRPTTPVGSPQPAARVMVDGGVAVRVLSPLSPVEPFSSASPVRASPTTSVSTRASQRRAHAVRHARGSATSRRALAASANVDLDAAASAAPAATTSLDVAVAVTVAPASQQDMDAEEQTLFV